MHCRKLQRTGGTELGREVTKNKNCAKILKITSILLGMLLFCANAQAQEITAVDFNGELIGKVIPDGKVVSFDNQLIGNVTADSLILDFDGEIIGGVVPQGIAIGNDNKPLGKVNNDGSVRLASGKIIAKVLPNGLVLDDFFNVVGSVLFPGLIYSDDGKTIGRLTGDGLYTNLQGQAIGFVSPDGYAYRKVGQDYILDGRLISSKMVVSLSGEFIGSVAPGGNVTNFETQTIGYVKANGFVYNKDNQVIGSIVRSSYALDNSGKYLGFVTYNGEVVEKNNVVGRVQADETIVNSKGEIIGSIVDFSATATDLNGKYLGRVVPQGKVRKGKDDIGRVGSGGVILSENGELIGKIIKAGPVFDYKGTLKAHALKNGSIVTMEGTPAGYIMDNIAYENTGRAIGATMKNLLAVNANNQVLGMVGISGSVMDGEEKKYMSPFGYLFSADGKSSGRGLNLSSIYNITGTPVAQIMPNGQLTNKNVAALGKLTQSGFNVDERNLIIGKNLENGYFVDSKGSSIGLENNENLIQKADGSITGKYIPDGSVVTSQDNTSVNMMPQQGKGSSASLALLFNGRLAGYVNDLGVVKDFGGANLGKITAEGALLDNSGSAIGGAINYTTSIDDKCSFLGVVTSRGEVRNYRDTVMGRPLLNGQIVSENGSYIGYSINPTAVIDYNGNIIGTVSSNGQVLNYGNNNLGCIDKRGFLKSDEGVSLAHTIEYYPVMNFNGVILGRSVLDGQIVNTENQFIGYQQANGNVNSKTGAPIGHLFKYRYAFSLADKYIGRITEEGVVLDNQGNNIGQVDFEGNVIKDNYKIGYALYDFYIYDNDFEAIGVIQKDGSILSFVNQNLGRLSKGFLLDKNGEVKGRGNRDFYIRDDSNRILGELLFKGELRDINNSVLGTITKNGSIIDSNGRVIAMAKPLQYYGEIAEREKVFDVNGNLLGYVNEDGTVTDENGKIIGTVKNGKVVDEKGNVVGELASNKLAYDANGNIIGKVLPDGSVMDNSGKIIGKIGENGAIIDANGNTIGTIIAPETPSDKPGWYKAPSAIPEIGLSPEEEKMTEKYRRSLGIALTPDGEYLGEIMEDGSVVNKEGKVVGHRMPDGLVIDDEGALIGIEESAKPSAEDMFIPAGTFGQGGAYGTGSGPGGNLGPGGGFGPGERYDPQRAMALDAAQQERRSNMQVGKISSNISPDTFDGMQKDWEEQGIKKAISSWRVNLSEMIFADKPIPAVIARSIDSNNPTPVTAYVERNIYAEEGRNIIIPAGSRLMGTLGNLTGTSETTSQSAKVQISWERLIRPDGSLFVFSGVTGDAQGRGGALGYLDQQLFKKYTLPILTTALTSYTSYMMADDENDDSSLTETPKQQAANDARQNFLDQMNQVFEQILSDKTNIRPLTYVPAGTRIIVYPNVDLWMRTRERNPKVDPEKRRSNILINSAEVATVREKNRRDAPVGGNVVYQSQGPNMEIQSRSPALLNEADTKKNNQANNNNPQLISSTAAGATPPPPPSFATSSTPGAATTNNTQKTDSSVPQLF